MARLTRSQQEGLSALQRIIEDIIESEAIKGEITRITDDLRVFLLNKGISRDDLYNKDKIVLCHPHTTPFKHLEVLFRLINRMAIELENKEKEHIE